MQHHLKFNNVIVEPPDEDGYSISLATTSSSKSGRTLAGNMKNSPLFTVEAYNLKWSDLKAEDCSKILKEIVGKSEFDFYHFNVYKAQWETGKFYASNFNTPIYSLIDGEERIKELSFQVTGVNPL